MASVATISHLPHDEAANKHRRKYLIIFIIMIFIACIVTSISLFILFNSSNKSKGSNIALDIGTEQNGVKPVTYDNSVNSHVIASNYKSSDSSSSESDDDESNRKPNIIYILMDDLGFTDTGYYSNYHNKNDDYSFSTPIIEGLASNGIILNYHYSEPTCSTTRSALLSGRYGWRTGIDTVLSMNSVFHTNEDFTLFAEILKNEYNYNTLMVGKWHIGYKSLTHLPFNRGFDECLFYNLGLQHYYTKTACKSWSYFDNEAVNLPQTVIDERNSLFGSNRICAYDLWDENYNIIKSNVYNERVFTNKIIDFINTKSDENDPFFIYYAMATPHTPLVEPPLNDPDSKYANYTLCDHITEINRKMICQMTQYGDSLIGEIVDIIENKAIMDNTFIIFASDNGPASFRGGGQTLPLRGRKAGVFEGGIRTAAFIYGAGISHNQCEYNNLFHITDWYPTILQMIDSDEVIDEIDGIGLWSNILTQCGYNDDDDDDVSDDDEMTSNRNLIISARMCNNEYFVTTYVRTNEWKLVVNNSEVCPGEFDVNFGDPGFMHYINYDRRKQIIPPQNIYNDYISNENFGEYFRSICYDEMKDEDKNENNTLFAYSDIMLFKIDKDAIEACDVSDLYPDIVDELLLILDETVRGNYYGSLIGDPSASSVLAQFESYDCDLDETYVISWADKQCCNDDTFNNWTYVWNKAIQIKQNCT